MGDWNNLKRCDASAVRSIGNDVNAELKKLLGTEAELRESATPRHWDGEGADAAARSLLAIEQGVQNRVAEHSALRTAIDDAADRIDHLRREIEAAEEVARTHMFEIVDGAVVERPVEVPGGPAGRAPEAFAEVKAMLEGQVAEIIRTGLDIDVDLTNVMLAIAEGRIEDDGATTLAQAATAGIKQGDSTSIDPPKNGTPEQNKAWWDTLSGTEREHLIKNRPELIGNLKGLPYKARSEANLNRIPKLREDMNARITEIEHLMSEATGGMGDQLASWQEELKQLQAKLDALDALELQADNGNLITSLDPSGPRVRAAVGIGDVDGADNVAVFVPGMNSAVERNMAGYVNEMNEMTGYAQEMLRPGETQASVVWMDYHAPQGVDTVLGDTLAEEGSRRLAAELEGMQGSRTDNPPDRLAVIGHSYGSTTAGLALKQTDAADAYLSQGSPGWGDGGGEGMKVPKGEFYDMHAHNDIVADSGWHGGRPAEYDGVRVLSTDEGRTPNTGERLPGETGHQRYIEYRHGQSMPEYNTAAVMAGRGDLYVDQPTRIIRN